MSNHVTIERDYQGEKNKPKYTCYQMSLKDEIIGFANYRLFKNQDSYWYIDEFLILEAYRGKRYGLYLMRDIIDKMWNEEKLPIHIYPTGEQIPKEEFIRWLVNRGFVQESDMYTKQIFCILHPTNSE